MPRLPRFTDLPPMAAPVTVVGDVHLSASPSEARERFLAFLTAREGRGGTLVLLGDLFDAWVGRGQERDPQLASVLEALARVARSGVALCFQAGNRDFAFRGVPGLPLTLWPEVVCTSWGGRRVLLTHGDLLVSGDHGYLRLRRWTRSRFARVVLATLPYRWLQLLARGLRRSSMRAIARKERRLLDIDYGLARRWLEAAGADVLVAGHVHTGVHHRLPGARPLETLVLKDWSPAGSAVQFDGERIALVAV